MVGVGLSVVMKVFLLFFSWKSDDDLVFVLVKTAESGTERQEI